MNRIPTSFPSEITSPSFYIVPIFLIFITTITIRGLKIWQDTQNQRSPLKRQKLKTKTSTSTAALSDRKKTLVVLGSGGHTTEMIALLAKLNPERYSPLVYVIAETDTTSENRLNQYYKKAISSVSSSESSASSTQNHSRHILNPDTIYKIPRAREVGQSYISSIFTTLHSLIYSIYICMKEKPDLILCNGPGTCLPIVLSAFSFRVLGVTKAQQGKVVFCESFCRVER